MGSFSIRENLAHVAIALLLTTPATTAPSRLMGRGCLSNIVSDLSCADSSIMTRCIAIENVDAELLATCLEAAGCTEDEAENALWITEKCQAASTSGENNTHPDEEGELRRRFHARNNKRADSTTASEESTSTSASATSTSSETSSSTSSSASTSATSSTTATSTTSSSTTSTSTTSSASATSTSSSSSSVNITLSSAIVGTTLAVAAVLAFGGVFICAFREGAAKRKAKREAAQKEALMSNIG